MEKIVFRSRVSVWLCALVYALLVAAFWPIVYDFSWSLLLIFLLTMGAVSYGFFGITYTIEGHVLWVRMLGRQRYDIMQLQRVASTRTWIAAPAASTRRIELLFASPSTPLIISPCHQDRFIACLRQVNPAVAVKLD